MPESSPRTASGGAFSTVRRRVLLGVAGLAGLTVLAGLLLFLTRPEGPVPAPETPRSPTAARSSEAPDAGRSDASSRVPFPAPPRTDDPVVFAKAAAKVLWSYDTRVRTRREHLAGLKEWMTDEEEYADWESVSAQVPDPVLWSRMRDNLQRATAEVSEAHFPQSFEEAMVEDPGAITTAYVYAVTVTGEQTIAWAGSGAGAEPRAVTLAVQCRPEQSCALAGVVPRVGP